VSFMWTYAIGFLILLGLVALLAGGRGPRRQKLVRAVIVGVAGASALIAYGLTGEPGATDVPFAERAAELESRSPDEMTREEVLVRLQLLKAERPDDPQPHYFTAQLLVDEGRDEEALRAFQSALRRNGEYVPALIGMADVFVRLDGGNVPREAAQLYGQAFALDTNEVRAGFMAGLRFWQQGEEAQARRVWDSVATLFPEGDPRQAELARLIQSAEREPFSGSDQPG
jgi:cytochrome c-type biogenesis protein CcmH/NrfG